MSDMKCPICQHKLHKINIIVSTCVNDKCKLWGSSIPNLVLGALAQTKRDLEYTRKALELAIDTLYWYDENCDSIVARNTLDEIKTTLKQKEVK